jgi:UV excision repair protein RAD23
MDYNVGLIQVLLHDQLKAMEFDRALVIEAFLACNKNEQLAVKYLMAHGGN